MLFRQRETRRCGQQSVSRLQLLSVQFFLEDLRRTTQLSVRIASSLQAGLWQNNTIFNYWMILVSTATWSSLCSRTSHPSSCSPFLIPFQTLPPAKRNFKRTSKVLDRFIHWEWSPYPFIVRQLGQGLAGYQQSLLACTHHHTHPPNHFRLRTL